METEIVAPATPPIESTSPVDAPPETPPAEPTIAEHEAQFGAGTPKVPTPDDSASKPRHRAQKDKARAEDAPRIAELTKRLRDAERERDEWKAKHVAPPPEPARPTVVAAPERSTGKPTLLAFEALIGTKYETYADAVDAYEDARDEWKDAQAKQAKADADAQKTQQEAEAKNQQEVTAHLERVQAYAVAHPDYESVTAPILNVRLPGVLLTALVRSDQSPEMVYRFGQQPDVLDELILYASALPVDADSVALLQRRLQKLVAQTAPTGSVAPTTPRPMAPRPPNPVRTGPLKTNDEPPGDDASIAEHEKYYGKRRR